MNRRSFLASLLGACIAAPAVAQAVPARQSNSLAGKVRAMAKRDVVLDEFERQTADFMRQATEILRLEAERTAAMKAQFKALRANLQRQA